MRTKLLYLAIAIFTLSSCDIDINSDWDDPKDPYEDYSARMIDRICIEQNNVENDYIYYNYDRRGRIITIDNTFYKSLDHFIYNEDKYGDEIITVNNNLGEDRDIVIGWNGYAEEEHSFTDGVMTQSIAYKYLSDQLRYIDVEEYYNDGSIFSEEHYDFDFDYNDNLRSIERQYEEYEYYEEIKLSFSAFCECRNDYNVDILSILGLYIDDDFASRIGRTGLRSRYLPTRATLRVKRNGRYDNDILYDISYVVSRDYITSITVTTNNGSAKRYHFSYK